MRHLLSDGLVSAIESILLIEYKVFKSIYVDELIINIDLFKTSTLRKAWFEHKNIKKTSLKEAMHQE